MRRSSLLLVVTLVAALASLGAVHDGDHDHYEPPYALGPSGGDSFNHLHAGDDGRMVVGRAYPVVSVLSCSAEGGYITYEIVHPATAPVETVSVAFAEALLDPYVFATVNVIDDDGRFLGTFKQRGELIGDGTFEVDVEWPAETEFRPRDIRIQFGLELTSACPSADVGTMRFPGVSVG